MITGNDETIKKCRNATPNDKWCHVNFDAIDKLPEEFEAVITEVPYTMADFSDIGGKTYMPDTNLMYRIAEACGISGGNDSKNDPLIEEVDRNRVMKDFDSPPNIIKMVVGRTVKKYSTILQEDGTERKSSVCTSSYNAYERCCELWSKEEMYTEGYTKQGQFPNKYDTRWKRQAHLDSEIKFSSPKAETKAHMKTIRELAGLSTGYKADELSSGFFVFSKIRRSSAVLKMETAARLQALSNGHQSSAAKLLFSNVEPEPEPEMKKAEDAKVISVRDELIATIGAYIKNGVIHPDDTAEASRIIEWAGKASIGQPIELSKFWGSVIDSLKSIEKKIPEEGLIHHNIYKSVKS